MIPYFGELVIYNPSIKNIIFRDAFVIITDHIDEDIVFEIIKGINYYSVIKKDGRLVVKSSSREKLKQRPLYSVDIHFTDNLSEACSIELFESRQKEMDIPENDIDYKLINYKRAINRYILNIRKNNTNNYGYTRLNDTLIIDLSDEDLEKNVSKQITGYIQNIRVFLTRIEKKAFQIVNSNKSHVLKSLKHSGKIRLEWFSDHESSVIRKYSKFKTVFHTQVDPISPINKLKQLFYNTHLNNSFQNNFTIPSYLNSQQKIMFTNMISNNLSIVQGLAGTGKTTTVVEVLRYLSNNSNDRVLVVTHTHRAIDIIIEKLLEKEVQSNHIVRLATRNTQDKISHSLKFLNPKSPNSDINKTRNNVIEKLEELISKETNEIKLELQEKMKSIFDTNPDIISQLLTSTKRFTFCTLDALQSLENEISGRDLIFGDYSQKLFSFDLIIFEDSSDINFPSFYYSAQFGSRWIIIGDPNQANPVISASQSLPRYNEISLPSLTDDTLQIYESGLETEISRYRSTYGHIKSGERLLREQVFSSLDHLNLKDYFMRLKIWYRPTAQFAEILVSLFPKIKNFIDTSKLEDYNYQFPIDMPLEIINSCPDKKQFAEVQVNNDGKIGYKNIFEIRLIISYLRDFINNYKQENKLSIAICTPYISQKEEIIEYLLNNTTLLSLNSDLKSSYIDITVNTIHNLKNYEYDILIFSATRSQIKFQLNDINELFTAFSRPKKSLILLFDQFRFKNGINKLRNEIHSLWAFLLTNSKYNRIVEPWSDEL